VQAILAARIDRLTPEAKRLLQAAAVIDEANGMTRREFITLLGGAAAMQNAHILCRSGRFWGLAALCCAR
jgi:hypothetical protein